MQDRSTRHEQIQDGLVLVAQIHPDPICWNVVDLRSEPHAVALSRLTA